MYSIGGIPQYKHTLGTASNYFSEWLMLMFNGYFVLPMTGSFIAAASPNLNIEKINKHYDHLKQYVDTDQLKQYLYFSEILQTFRKRLKSDTALQKIFEEAEKMTQKDGMAYLKQHVSDEEYNALEFANDKEKHHRMLSPKAQIMIHAGGLNNNVYMTQRIEDEIWLNQGQHMQLTTNYFMDKTSTFLQTLLTSEVLSAEKLFSNIPLDYVCVLDTWSNDLDIKISRTELQLYSILSYFLSAQTYMNMYQVYQTWMNGENQVYPAEWKGIRLPNVGLYLTTKGPTYNVRSGYRWGESLFFIVGTEFVLNGKQVIEGTLGIRKVFPTVGNSYIHGEVVFNHEAVGGTLYGGSKLFNTVNIEAGITYHNVNTLLGERHIPSLLTGSTDIETWIKLGVQY
jgi:hypothetical protein